LIARQVCPTSFCSLYTNSYRIWITLYYWLAPMEVCDVEVLRLTTLNAESQRRNHFGILKNFLRNALNFSRKHLTTKFIFFQKKSLILPHCVVILDVLYYMYYINFGIISLKCNFFIVFCILLLINYQYHCKYKHIQTLSSSNCRKKWDKKQSEYCKEKRKPYILVFIPFWYASNLHVSNLNICFCINCKQMAFINITSRINSNLMSVERRAKRIFPLI